MLVEIQVLPRPSGTPDAPYANVDRAIALAREAGVRFEVGAMGTVLEGEPDQLWPLVRAMHESCLAAGADHTMTMIKVAERSGADATIDELTAAHRT
ncbi:MAG: thiamine-binding protein [Actinomycetota bacterium]|nr:thiamine-binding protein [Actinomycetota bacterium]